jgi:protocatechuate 3,4-dioxygenase beta subunit
MSFSRREFLGLGTLLVAACSSPTLAIADDDDMPPRCGPATSDNIEGPFYKSGAPHRAVLATSRDPGVPFAVAGTVMTTSCEPIANAELDIWHANARGDYDLDGFRFRGALTTDMAGRWQLRTIVPGRYLNGATYRPAHLHVKVRAPGHPELTTQLYFAGDPYNAKDPFIVTSLIMRHRAVRGVRHARFDFVLS